MTGIHGGLDLEIGYAKASKKFQYDNESRGLPHYGAHLIGKDASGKVITMISGMVPEIANKVGDLMASYGSKSLTLIVDSYATVDSSTINDGKRLSQRFIEGDSSVKESLLVMSSDSLGNMQLNTMAYEQQRGIKWIPSVIDDQDVTKTRGRYANVFEASLESGTERVKSMLFKDPESASDDKMKLVAGYFLGKFSRDLYRNPDVAVNDSIIYQNVQDLTLDPATYSELKESVCAVHTAYAPGGKTEIGFTGWVDDNMSESTCRGQERVVRDYLDLNYQSVSEAS